MALLVLCCSCSDDSPTRSTDERPIDAWIESAEPASRGFDVAGLSQARAFSEQIQSAAVVVVHDGYVVARWGRPEQKFYIASIRKSLLNALYGIHVEAGAIDLTMTLEELGIDDAPVALTVTEKRARVSDLLASRSGIYIPSASQSASARAALPERGSQAPGTHFYYNNWDFNALGSIFEQLTGKGIFVEFADRIGAPLQIDLQDGDTGYFYERDLSVHPAYHFEMRPIDLAKFGLLYLRQGRWHNEQLIPADWIEASTTSYSNAGEGTGYGYLWWTINDGSYTALGFGGQWIHVIPDEDIVIVHMADVDNGISVSTPDYIALSEMIRDAGPAR